jgi:glycosyltransferase involved in cell wall biosynthesis
MANRPLNVLWLIDHVCFDGSLHAGGRLYMNVLPRVDTARVRLHSYFLNASDDVVRVFKESNHPAVNLGVHKYNPLGPLRVWDLVRKHDIDVMHLFCFGAGMYGRMVSSVSGLPTVIHETDTPTYGPQPTMFKAIDRVLAGRTDFALATSTHCRDFVRDQRYIPAEKIAVLYHAVPREKFEIARSLTREAARAELGWSPDAFAFLAVTKLGPDRGNETLIEAFAEVKRQLPSATLHVVYRPTLYHRIPEKYKDIPWVSDPAAARTRIEELIDEHGVRDSVKLVQMEAPERHEPYYAASDVLVVPFEDPRFSSVNLVESMVFGMPGIVTDVGEPADIVDRWGAGVKVPPRDPHALARMMLTVARDPALRLELSRKARAAAVDFAADTVADGLTRLYERVARGERVRATPDGAMV